MKSRTSYFIAVVAAGALAGALVSAARENDAPPWLVTTLTALMMLIFIVGGSLGVFAMKRRAQRENRTNEDDSFERHMAVQVQARVFLDILFLTVIFGCLFIIFPRQMNPAWVLLAIGVVSLIDFWVRFALAKRVDAAPAS